MSIQDLFDASFSIYALKTVSGRRKAFQSTATVEGHLQTHDRTMQGLQGIIEYREIVWYVDVDAPIIKGYKVLDRRTNKWYVIKEYALKNYGINDHIEVILEETND